VTRAGAASSPLLRRQAVPKKQPAATSSRRASAKEKAAPETAARRSARQTTTSSTDVPVLSIDSQASVPLSELGLDLASFPDLSDAVPSGVNAGEDDTTSIPGPLVPDVLASPTEASIAPRLPLSSLRKPGGSSKKNSVDEDGMGEDQPRAKRVALSDEIDVQALSPVEISSKSERTRMRPTFSSSSSTFGGPSMTATPSMAVAEGVADRALERSSQLLAQLMTLDLPDLERDSSSEEEDDEEETMAGAASITSRISRHGRGEGVMTAMASTMSMALEQNDVPSELIEVLMDMWMKINELEEAHPAEPTFTADEEHMGPTPSYPAALTHEFSSLQRMMKMMTSTSPNHSPRDMSEGDGTAPEMPQLHPSLQKYFSPQASPHAEHDNDEDLMTSMDSTWSTRSTIRRKKMCHVPVDMIKVLASFWQHIRSKETAVADFAGAPEDDTIGRVRRPSKMTTPLGTSSCSTKSSAGSARSSHESYDSPARPVQIDPDSTPSASLGACLSPHARAEGAVPLLSPRTLRRQMLVEQGVADETSPSTMRTEIGEEIPQDLIRMRSPASEVAFVDEAPSPADVDVAQPTPAQGAAADSPEGMPTMQAPQELPDSAPKQLPVQAAVGTSSSPGPLRPTDDSLRAFRSALPVAPRSAIGTSTSGSEGAGLCRSWQKAPSPVQSTPRLASHTVARQSSAPVRSRAQILPRSAESPMPRLNIPLARPPSLEGVARASAAPQRASPIMSGEVREIYKPDGGENSASPLLGSGNLSRMPPATAAPGIFRPLGAQQALCPEPVAQYTPRDRPGMFPREAYSPLSTQHRPYSTGVSPGSPLPSARQVSAPYIGQDGSYVPQPRTASLQARASSVMSVASAQGDRGQGSASARAPGPGNKKVMRKVAVTTIYTFYSDY